MKNVKWLFAVLWLGLSAVSPARMVNLVNWGFDLPGTGKIQCGVDCTPDVPGWRSAGTFADSGVEIIAGTNWAGFIMNADPGPFWNTSPTDVFGSGITYTVSVNARNSWTATLPSLLRAELYYLEGETRVVVKGQTFTLGANWSPFATYSFTFNSDEVPACVGKPIGIQVDNVTAAGNAWLQIDWVRIDSEDKVGNPSPANSAINVPLDSSRFMVNPLSWTMPSGWLCDLYFGPQSEPNLIAVEYKRLSMSSATSWVVSVPLDYTTPYYWRVDVYEPNIPSGYKDKIIGPLWSFTTMPQTPVFTSQPWPVVAAAGSNAAFTVNTLNAATHAWYKKGNPAALVSDGINYTITTGANSSTLTVLNVVLADEGAYYCVITDGGAQTVESAKAVLVTRRLMAHWKMDNNLNDEQGVYHGTSTDTTYGDGKNGRAKAFTQGQDYVTIPGSEEMFNFYPVSFTISAWVKLTGTAAWRGIMGCRGPAFTGFALGSNGDGDGMLNLRGHFGMDTGDGNLYGSTFIIDDQWHLLTAAFDISTGLAKVYINGVLEATSNSQNYGPSWIGNTYPLIIGAWGYELNEAQMRNNASITGLVDDVRIYSYALNPVEVARLYIDFNPGVIICAESLAADIANHLGQPIPDCRVNLYDFAAFARDWLECNEVPTCK